MPGDEIAEAVSFLDWLAADNFTLLGVREYRMPEGDVAADPVEGSGLGMLRDPAVKVLRRGRELVAMTPEIRAFLCEPVPLIVTKANVKSRVHRRVHLDYIGHQALSRRREARRARCASSACSPPAPTRARAARSLSAPQGGAR